LRYRGQDSDLAAFLLAPLAMRPLLLSLVKSESFCFKETQTPFFHVEITPNFLLCKALVRANAAMTEPKKQVKPLPVSQGGCKTSADCATGLTCVIQADGYYSQVVFILFLNLTLFFFLSEMR